MKALNQLISDYTEQLQHGEMQAAYKGILDFMGGLRADFIKKYPYYDTGSVYQGYMDMSYLSLSTKFLKDRGLKIAIVYLHEKGDFEIWLSARNREIAKKYEDVLNSKNSNILGVFHDENNKDAILECTLTITPNFEDQASLMNMIEQGAERFITSIVTLL